MAREMPQLAGVRHRFVDAGELKTHVAVAGEGDPVVLLHGWPEHWYAWRGVIPRLAERYRVIAPDLRGFGWTDIAWKGFEKENMADDVIRLLDAMEIDRARIVGHDWGGWIGYLLALRSPDRVEQLVAIGAPPPWPRLRPRDLLAARRLAYQVVLASPFGRRMLQRGPGHVRRVIRRWSSNTGQFSKEDFRIYGRDLKSPTRARASARLDRTVLRRARGPGRAGRYRGRRLETPTLLLHGKEDRPVPPRLVVGHDRHADDLQLQLVPNAGHFLPEERPKLVAERILHFFEAGRPAPVASD